jgi:hypothetical protein
MFLTFQAQIKNLRILSNIATVKLSGVYFEQAQLGMNDNWDLHQV